MIFGDVFIGRDAEVQQLHLIAGEVRRSTMGRLVVVRGPAGAGKTRLCQHLGSELEEQGARLAFARCWSDGGGPPLWPWPEIVAELVADTTVASGDGHRLAEVDRFGVFADLTDRLRRTASQHRCVVMIDDLHLANRDVVSLTRFVARSLHGIPLLLIATWRDDTGADFGRLVDEGQVIDLPPLGTAEVGKLVRSYEPNISPQDLEQLTDLSGGNPLHLIELVRGGPMRTGLAVVLAQRAAALGPSERLVLGAAALMERDTSIRAIAAAAGFSVDDAIAIACRAWPGVSVTHGQIQFPHDLVRGAIGASLTRAEREALHRSAIGSSRGQNVESVLLRARHSVELARFSDDWADEAIRRCRDAANLLVQSLAFEQAVEWAATASELAALTGDVRTQAELLIEHASAVLACGRLGDARSIFERALVPAREANDPRLLGMTALGLAGLWVEEQRDELSRRTMLSIARAALAALPTDEGPLRARLAMRIAVEEVYDGADITKASEALSHARSCGDAAALAECLSLYHHSLLLPQYAEERLAIAEELLDVAPHAAATIYSLFGLCWRTVDLYLSGDRLAERSFTDLRMRSQALGNQSIEYIVAVLDVMRTLRAGDIAQAEVLADKALAMGLAAGDADAIAYYGGHLMAIRWVQGRIGEMVEMIRSVIDSSTLRRRDLIYDALLAYATVMSGDRAEARLLLAAAVSDGVDEIPVFSTWLGTMAILIETAVELGEAEMASALAARFKPFAHLPVMPSLAVACLGPGERVMARALACTGQHKEAIVWFRSALVANGRLRNRPFEAILRADLADSLMKLPGDGTHAEARGLITEAIEIAEALDMKGRAEQWRLDADPVGPATRITPAVGVLQREVRGWSIRIDERHALMEDLIGVHHLAVLLTHPDLELRAEEISTASGNEVTVDDRRGDAQLDEKARLEYRRRLEQLSDELDRADSAGDVDRCRRAVEERDVLLAALRSATGLGGRPRYLGSDGSERSRMKVSRAIRRSLDRLATRDPVIARALESCIRTGHRCSYVPDLGHPVEWTVRTSFP